MQATIGQGERGRALHLGDGCANSGQVREDSHLSWRSGELAQSMAAFQQSATGEGGLGKGALQESHWGAWVGRRIGTLLRASEVERGGHLRELAWLPGRPAV